MPVLECAKRRVCSAYSQSVSQSLVFVAVLLRELNQLIGWMQTEYQLATCPQTKPTNFAVSPPVKAHIICIHHYHLLLLLFNWKADTRFTIPQRVQ